MSSTEIDQEREFSHYETENVSNTNAVPEGSEDAEIIAMKQRVAEMEAEAAKLRELNEAAEREMEGAAPAHPTEEERMKTDARSIYVGNVRCIVSYTGGLWRDARGDSATLSELWHDSPRYYSV